MIKKPTSKIENNDEDLNQKPNTKLKKDSKTQEKSQNKDEKIV